MPDRHFELAPTIFPEPPIAHAGVLTPSRPQRKSRPPDPYTLVEVIANTIFALPVNKLYFGDNLDILRERHVPGFVDADGDDYARRQGWDEPEHENLS